MGLSWEFIVEGFFGGNILSIISVMREETEKNTKKLKNKFDEYGAFFIEEEMKMWKPLAIAAAYTPLMIKV